MTTLTMRLGAALLLAACAGATYAAPAVPCPAPAPEALRTTWQAFRTAALAGDPKQVAAFYRFPLKLKSPYDGDKPLVVPRPAFLHNYELLFRKGPADTEVNLYTALKKTTGAEPIGQYVFDAARCHAVAPIGDYEFTYRRDGGWKIESLYYAGDLDIARDARLDKVQD